MLDLKAFYRPASLEEAMGLLAEHGDRARPLAGGSSLVFAKGAPIDALVDLGRVGLDTLSVQQAELHIGAMVKVSALRKHLAHRDSTTALTDASNLLYSRVVQNHVTCGGNCVMVYGWADLPIATWALGARFALKSPDGEREVDADTFFAKHPSKLLGKAELLTTIIVPAAQPGEGSAYRKQQRDETDEAIASAAARVLLTDGKVAAARIVCGAVRPLPQRFDAPAGLIGNAPSSEVISAAAAAIAEGATVTDNYLASAEYRRDLLAATVEDALTVAVERAGGAK
jgi:carbon-monoxide dehydrogenase medium subunit